jgi:hypothetical protein
VFVAHDRVTGERVALKIGRFPIHIAAGKDELHQQYWALRRAQTDSLVKPLGLYVHQAGGTSIINRRAVARPRSMPGFMVLALENVDNGAPLRDWYDAHSRLDRLEVLQRVASALAELKKGGPAHGDVHVGNVLVVDQPFRVVVIDPQAASTGFTGAGPSTADKPDQDDRMRFGMMMEEVIGAGDPSASQLARSLQDETSDRPDLETVAVQLRGLINKGAVLTTSASIDDLGAWYTADASARHDLYRKLRQDRDQLLIELSNRVRAASKKLGMGTSVSQWAATALEPEVLSDHADRGVFVERELRCKTLDGDTWKIQIERVKDFRKPWPMRDAPGFLGEGNSALTLDGQNAHGERFRVIWKDGAASLALDHQLSMDDWIEKSLQYLCEARFRVLEKPLRLGQGARLPVLPFDHAKEVTRLLTERLAKESRAQIREHLRRYFDVPRRSRPQHLGAILEALFSDLHQHVEALLACDALVDEPHRKLTLDFWYIPRQRDRDHVVLRSSVPINLSTG